MLRYRESLGQRQPPDAEALEFRQATEDAITQNSGPALRGAMVRLMKHPAYRAAHGTDEHFIPALFCAGAAGDWEDVGTKNVLAAESWELTNMCNSQFTMGKYIDDDEQEQVMARTSTNAIFRGRGEQPVTNRAIEVQ